MNRFIHNALLCSVLLCSQALMAAACQDSFIPISSIQGEGDSSPLLGETITTQGVIQTVIYPDSRQPSLVLSSQQPDKNLRTSEALIITDKELVRLGQPGQVWQLTGTVREINNMTTLTNISRSALCTEQPIAKALAVNLPLQRLTDWEQYEGMLLQFPQPLIVNDSYNLARYGELLLADRRLMVATEVKLPGTAAVAFEQQQKLAQLVIDDGSNKQNVEPIRFPAGHLSAKNTVRIGDSVLALQGYLIQDRNGYRLLVSQTPEFKATNPRPSAPAKKVATDLRVASFNVLNFFTGAGQKKPFPTRRGATSAEELQRQQAKMLAALSAMDADIIGLLEVENNGFGPGSALATIVSSLNNSLGQEVYRLIEPASKPGSDAIMVAMIYRPSAVALVGNTAVNTAAPFNQGSRPPLAQSFKHLTSGQQLTVSINHLKSKGSCPKQAGPDSDQQDGQSCWNASRVIAAKALTAWLRKNPTGVDTANQLIIGDFNAYRQEDPLRQLIADGWQHLADTKVAHSSFVYQGRSGTLDHALASQSLQQKLRHFAHWSINADEPAVLDYNVEHKSASQQQLLYAPDPYRSSDHDPLYIDFKF